MNSKKERRRIRCIVSYASWVERMRMEDWRFTSSVSMMICGTCAPPPPPLPSLLVDDDGDDGNNSEVESVMMTLGLGNKWTMLPFEML